MVIMQMRDNDVIDPVWRQIKRFDGLDRRLQDRTATPLGLVGVIAGIHHDHAVTRFQNPDEIIHRVGLVMRRVQQKAFYALSVVPVGIFDGIDFPKCL